MEGSDEVERGYGGRELKESGEEGDGGTRGGDGRWNNEKNKKMREENAGYFLTGCLFVTKRGASLALSWRRVCGCVEACGRGH